MKPARLTRFVSSIVFAAAPGVAAATPPQVGGPEYRDAALPVEKRVADLLGRMTLAEKVAQVSAANWQHTYLDDPRTHKFSPAVAAKLIKNGIGAITRPHDKKDPQGALAFANDLQRYLVTQTRLGIPALLHEEALHGLTVPGATSFPQAIALAATFDPALVEEVFTVAARQARNRGVHHVLAPVLDVARDPRWGRIEETYGEDPHLVSRLGVAAIRGFQGRRSGKQSDAPYDADRVMATGKHFTAHGQPEGGRNTAPGNVSPHVIHEVFLPPFLAAVREADLATIMASYNEVDGQPPHGNKALLDDLLRREIGFKGMIVSDYFGIAELQKRHHVVVDVREAGRRAIEAGIDIELPEPEAFTRLAEDVKAGHVPAAALDRAVSQVLRAKFMMGLFERPYVEPATVEPERAADRALARRAAEEAIILLKNDRGLLPLDPAKLKSIAVIGPNAVPCRLGGYSGVPTQAVGVVDGVKARLGGKVQVLSAEGCGLTMGGRGWVDDVVELSDPAEDARLVADAARLAASADVTLLVLGQNEQLSREGWADNHRGDRMELGLVGRQNELARAVLATGKPVVLLLIHGGPLAIPELAAEIPAILDGFYLGEETGTAVAAVLFGDANPAGRLPVTVPRSGGALPAYYNYKPSARRLYLFEQEGPLWPFGHGLSYTTFKYDKPVVMPARIPVSGKARVTVTVRNTGKRAGDEVVQLYLHDLVSSVTRPVQELKGFRRVNLKAGESKRIEFVLGPDELSLLDANMKRVVEPGRFEIMVGGSSAHTQSAVLDVVQ